MGFITTTDEHIASGGTVTGDLTIDADLTVTGSTAITTNEVLQGTSTIDVTNTEAFLVRKDSDGGDIFIVDTTNRDVTVSDTLIINPTISSGSETTLAFQRSGTNKWRFIQPSDDSYLKLYNDQATATQMYFKSDNSIGIGTDNPACELHISSAGTTQLRLEGADASSDARIEFYQSTTAKGFAGFNDSTDTMAMVYDTTMDSTKGINIDSSGRIGIGNSSPDVMLTLSKASTEGQMIIRTHTADNAGSAIKFQKSRNTTESGFTIVSDGDYLGSIEFQASDNDSFEPGAAIRARINGTVSNDSATPTDLIFLTSSAQSYVERMRIYSSGDVTITNSGAGKPKLTLHNSNTSGSQSSHLAFEQGSTSQSDDQQLGYITFGGYRDNDSSIETMVSMAGFMSDITTADCAGEFRLQVHIDNSASNVLNINGFDGGVGQGSIVFNEDSKDFDFRVESDNRAHAFFIEGSTGNIAIHTDTPSASHALTIAGDLQLTEAHPAINFTDSDDNSDSRIYHSAGSLYLDADNNNEVGSSIMRFSVDDSEVMRLVGGGNVGIGTATSPHGGVGQAKLSIEGTDSNAAGPHVQYTTASDDYPVFQQLNWAHDTISLYFDSFYDGAEKSSDAGSNFRIFKQNDVFKFQYDSGVAQNSTITWNDGLILDTSGVVSVDNTIEVGGSLRHKGDTDNAIIFGTDTQEYYTGGTARLTIGSTGLVTMSGIGGNGLQAKIGEQDASNEYTPLTISSKRGTGSPKGSLLAIGNNYYQNSSGQAALLDTDVDGIAMFMSNRGDDNYVQFTYYDNSTQYYMMQIDENSRISLTNNDAGGSGGSDGLSANTIFGYLAGQDIASGGVDNTYFGHKAGSNNATGDDNTFIGSNAGKGVHGNSNDDNTGIGSDCMLAITTGTRNTAVGRGAGDNLSTVNRTVIIGDSAGSGVMTTGGSIPSNADGTVAVGYSALYALTTGDGNVAMGYQSATAMTTGARNVIIGYQAGDAMTIATRSVAIGYGALGAEDVGDRSIAIGFNSLASQNSDSDNETTGNVGVGVEAGFYNVTGIANTFVGYNSGKGTTSANNSYNTGLGWQSLIKIQDGGHNVSVGARSGEDLTTGDFNVFVGDYAGHATVDGDKCIAIGHSALAANVTSAGDGSIAIGYSAGGAITSGAENLTIGFESLRDMTTGSSNVAVGYYSQRLLNHADADCNVTVGNYTMDGVADVAIHSCTAVGHNALSGSLTATANNATAVGRDALKSLTSGAQNTAVGANCADDITTGGYNTAVGKSSLASLTTGSNNVALGRTALSAVADDESGNVAVGNSSMEVLKQDGTASSTNREVKNNIAIGLNALYGGTLTGTNHVEGCVAIGKDAMDATGANNQIGTIAIGQSALGALTSGSSNTAVGYQSMDATTAGSGNTALGYQTLSGDTDGDGGDNTAIGHKALLTAVSPSKNVAIGDSAMRVIDASANGIADCVAIGANAFYGDTDTTTDTDGTVAIGKDALKVLHNGQGNTAVGWSSMDEHESGRFNTCLGYGTMSQSGGDTTAQDNTFIGASAGGGDWAGAGVDANVAIGYAPLYGALNGANNNIAMGYHSMHRHVSGDSNIAIGSHTMEYSTANSENVAIGQEALGDVNQGEGANVAIGYYAMRNVDEGTGGGDADYNIAIGYDALKGGDFGGSDLQLQGNVAIGSFALDATGANAQTGSVAVGYQSLSSLTSGAGCTALGYETLKNISSGTYCTAIGYEAGKAITGSLNTVVGFQAADSLVSGTSNTVVGGRAFYAADGSETNSTIIGTDAGNAINHDNTDGNVIIGNDAGTGGGAALIDCIVIGYNAMNSTGNNAQTGTVAVGKNALTSLGAGIGSTAIGWDSGKSVTTGDYNTGYGYNTLGGNTGTALTGDRNTVIGASAGRDMEGATTNNVLVGDSAGILMTTGSYNTIIGTYAGDAITTSSNCTLIGREAGSGINSTDANGTVCLGNDSGEALTSAQGSTALGYQALAAEDDGDYSTAVGYQALKAQTGTSGAVANIALGYQAGVNITKGRYNTILGFQAMDSEDVGDRTVAVGYKALYSQNSDSDNEITKNTGVGFEAGYYNVTGTENTYFGYGAGGSGAGSAYSHSYNTAIGANSLISLTTGGYNTAVGQNSLDELTTGSYNVAIGNGALHALDGSETENVAIGYNAANNADGATNNVCIGSNAILSTAAGVGQIAIGKDVTCVANNTATLGIGSNTASLGLDGSDTSWAAASSDERLKENIETSSAGLGFINDLRPVTYNWKKAKDVDKSLPQYKDSDEPVLGTEYGEILHGFIAQEVKQAIDNHEELADGFKMWKLKDDGTQTVADGNLVPMLVKAVQELSSKVEDLEKQLKDK